MLLAVRKSKIVRHRRINRKFSEMIINLAQLKEGNHIFEGKDSIKSIGLDEKIFYGDVFTKAEVDKRGQNYYIKILSDAAGKFCCDRCLDDFNKKIISEAKIIYTENRTLVASTEKKDEIRYLRPENSDVDLSEDIRQILLLSIPVKILCSEECKGFCLKCRKNLNHEKCECKS